jgi:Zn-dependent peptidase ImmA (M78 family)
MRRGFKAQAERRAETTREELGLSMYAPLDSAELAAAQGISVKSADTLVGIERLEQLEALQPGAFSACTFDLPRGKVIVTNPLSSPQRIQSDVAHEVSHVLLEHEVRTVEKLGDFSFFSCDAEEEQEANWLAGCLLLPRPLLIRSLRRGITVEDIAQEFNVSVEMAAYRVRATGALRQVTTRKGTPR